MRLQRPSSPCQAKEHIGSDRTGRSQSERRDKKAQCPPNETEQRAASRASSLLLGLGLLGVRLAALVALSALVTFVPLASLATLVPAAVLVVRLRESMGSLLSKKHVEAERTPEWDSPCGPPDDRSGRRRGDRGSRGKGGGSGPGGGSRPANSKAERVSQWRGQLTFRPTTAARRSQR